MKGLSKEEYEDCEGLTFLTWSQFDSPDNKGSGKIFMEREPVLILDEVIRRTRMTLDIRMGYATPKYARMMGLTSKSQHRTGKAILLRVLCPKKRWKLIYNLMELGVTHIGLGREEMYFDTDDLKQSSFNLI